MINIKNNDNNCFLWLFARHLNLIKKHPERIKKEDKGLANNLNYERIEFPISRKEYCKIEKQNNIRINVFCYENGIIYPLNISDKKFSDCMDFLLIFDENKSQYVYIKYFNRLIFNKTKNKNKNHFFRCCLQCFSSENILSEHKGNCLVINSKQIVKLRKGSISFKNYSKQLPVLFKIYADFECILRPTSSKGIKSSDKNGSYTEKYQDYIPCSFTYKVVCVDNKFSKDAIMYKGKNAACKFIEAILEEFYYCKRIMKKHFNKNLVMSAEEKRFQLANSCWICNKLFDVGDEKVIDHCHVTGKYRGAAHFSCNTNYKLSKKVPVIFHKLRDYDSHLIVKKLGKFDEKVSVILDGLEKYMAFTVNKNLGFMDSMQFINSGLDSLLKNLSDNDFKYLSEKFTGELFELVKEKGVYPYEYINSSKKFSEDKLPDKWEFFNSLKDKYISQRANNVWNAFKMKTMSDYHDLYFKKYVFLLTDVCEKFIKTCLDYYGLDLCHYFSSLD